EPGAVPCDGVVADRVDAAVERVEAAGLEPVRDRAPRESEIHELRARHDPVLPARERRDRAIGVDRPTLCIHVMSNVGPPGHGPDRDEETATADRRIATELPGFRAS